MPVAKGIDAVKLEKEMAKMWGEAGTSVGGDSAAGVTRACALNLIVYSESQEERSEVDTLLEAVIERHPCRALVLYADRAASEARLEAFVSTRCQLSSRGAKKICGEQVTIEAGGQIVDTLSTAVSPLLVPDVPVFLWWKDIPHYDDNLFNRLARLADRVVIDSASFDNPHEDFLRMAQLLETNEGKLRLSDLNWGRLTTWRSLVASFWDVADYRASLDKIERVTIEYDRPDKSPDELSPKALLALGWLGGQLGWEVEPQGNHLKAREGHFVMRGGGRVIEAMLAGTDDTKGRDGYVVSITIKCEDGNEFFVRLRPVGAKLETGARTGGEHNIGRVLNYESRSEGQRLSGELDILTRDKVFEKAAIFAARLLVAAKQ
jgi:glucose-6-phosphate dehydrogenase assembly protein OpcA